MNYYKFNKTLDSFSKFFFTIAYILSVSISCNFILPEKETYLIPDTFAGEFRIIYGEQCGLAPVDENGRRILEIPHNGILIIQPKLITGTINHEYYLVDKAGNRKKITTIKDYEERRINLPGIFFSGTGNIAGQLPDGSLSSESPQAINFSHFIVFNEDGMTMDERERFEFHQNFDSPTNALVTECRKKINE